jgi:hypothetical protein
MDIYGAMELLRNHGDALGAELYSILLEIVSDPARNESGRQD